MGLRQKGQKCTRVHTQRPGGARWSTEIHCILDIAHSLILHTLWYCIMHVPQFVQRRYRVLCGGLEVWQGAVWWFTVLLKLFTTLHMSGQWRTLQNGDVWPEQEWSGAEMMIEEAAWNSSCNLRQMTKCNLQIFQSFAFLSLGFEYDKMLNYLWTDRLENHLLKLTLMGWTIWLWNGQLSWKLLLGWWNGQLWDEEYYMGLVAFRYSGQTVGHCPAAVFSNIFFLNFRQILKFHLQYVPGCCEHTPFYSICLRRVQFYCICYFPAMACQSLLLTIWRDAQQMSFVIVSYQMNMSKQSKKCSSLLASYEIFFVCLFFCWVYFWKIQSQVYPLFCLRLHQN